MYRADTEQLMILITSVDENAYVKYSMVTGKFYVHSDIWYMHEQNYRHSSEHRSTVDEAVRDFYKLIQGNLIKLGNSTDICILPKLIQC